MIVSLGAADLLLQAQSGLAAMDEEARYPRSWRIVDAVVKDAMCACGRNQAQRDRRPAMYRLEEFMRLVTLGLGGKETLPAAVPGDVDAPGARVELAFLGDPIGEELLIANLVAAPNEHVPAMRGRSPQLDVDLLALDYVKWLGRGRHADRIGDDAARGCDQGQGASRHGDFAAHRAPSRKYLGRSYSREPRSSLDARREH